MGRRIRWLGAVMIACFALAIVQLVNIQYAKAPALRASPNNPRNAAQATDNIRGDIYASDGTLLAQSVKSAGGSYNYTREYPGGALYSQVVGFDSTYEGTAGAEYEYNSDLEVHQEPAQNLSQALGLDPKPTKTDDVTLTIVPKLQEAAQSALSHIAGANQDAGIVAITPQTGAIVADYSTPNFDPAPLEAPNTAAGTQEQESAAISYFKTPDHEGFFPGLPLATAETFPPGSTFKVVTSSAVYNLDPSLSNFDFPRAVSTTFLNSTKVLTNDGGVPCGGTMAADMFAQSCDPGYAQLGVQLGASTLAQQGDLFGYNSRPPIDLPNSWVATPVFPPASKLTPPNQALLGYSAIGQYNDEASALSNALIAAGVANGGTIMTPHVVAQITDSQDNVVTTYIPTEWKQAISQSAAALDTALMKQVAISGTAAGVGFSPSLEVAVKTGTAQTGNPQENTDDWMIGFAPANDPTIAVAVVVPLQNFAGTGAGVAGPIMKEMLDAALLPPGSS
jgi:peptidoglycan glycosyltransferase